MLYRFSAYLDMYERPYPDWYCVKDDDSDVRLLTEDGRANPTLANSSWATLSLLAEAVHQHACKLDERQLRQLEGLLAMQRWRRATY